MNDEEKRALIDRYIAAYNAFDMDGMMAVLHPEIGFQNVSSGEVNASVSGSEEFRQLAERSGHLFSSRKQTVTGFRAQEDRAFIDVDYEAVLAADMPNGMKKGEILRLTGRTEFTFRDGRIYRIRDVS